MPGYAIISEMLLFNRCTAASTPLISAAGPQPQPRCRAAGLQTSLQPHSTCGRRRASPRTAGTKPQLGNTAQV